jgi:hypothetical protein
MSELWKVICMTIDKADLYQICEAILSFVFHLFKGSLHCQILAQRGLHDAHLPIIVWKLK